MTVRMHRARVPGAAAALFGVVGVAVGGVKTATVLAAPGPYKGLAFNSDDLYYYVLTALNAAQGRGSTFDGLSPTNGYQPLWFLVLTAFFRVLDVGRVGALVVTMFLLVALWVAALVLLYRIGRDLFGGAGAALGLAGFVVHARWWTGCENALVVVLLLGVVGVVVRSRPFSGDLPRARLLLGLGGLLAVLALARLDTVVLLGLLALAGLVRWTGSGRSRLRAAVLLILPTTAVLAAYALGNQALFGVPVPVSGLAKQLGPLGRNWSVFRDFLLFGQLGPVPLLFGASVLVLGGVALFLLAPARLDSLPGPLCRHAAEVRFVVGTLLLAQLLQLLYYAVASTWELQGWYFSFGVVALFLSLGVVGARVGAVPLVRPALALVVVGLALFSAAHEVGVVLPRAAEASPGTRDIDAGAWVDAHLPPDAVLAMGDWAGTFAYATHRPVIQLEGLVASPAYLRSLETGNAEQYLADRRVRYLVRLTHPGEVVGCQIAEPYFGGGPRVTFDVCGSPPVYDGDVGGQIRLVIWNVRPTSRGATSAR